jgi:hypothetical protein
MKDVCLLPDRARKLRWAGRWHVRVTREMHTEFWWRNVRERDHKEDLDVDERILLKMIYTAYVCFNPYPANVENSLGS